MNRGKMFSIVLKNFCIFDIEYWNFSEEFFLSEYFILEIFYMNDCKLKF